MTNIVTGVVTNGVVVPASPLPEGAQVEVSINVTPDPAESGIYLTAAELLKLPREQRDAYLAKGAAAAEELYRTNKELTGFNAFGEELDYDSDEG